MDLTSLPVAQLLRAFQSPDPVPGGGSASALAGAIGSSLLTMVATLPKPRVTGEEDATRLAAAGRRCGALSGELEALVSRDSEAYALVVAAYQKPKGTDAEKAARAAAIQAAMRAAIEAPLAVMRACADAARQGVVVAALGNRSASSDVLVGLELLGAGLRGAKLNVEINLDSVKDADYVAWVRAEVRELERALAAALVALPR